MKAVEFCYWLQGMFELQQPQTLNKKQTASIKKHLHMVFVHEIDPSYPNRKKLDEIHGEFQGLDEGNAGGEPGLIRC